MALATALTAPLFNLVIVGSPTMPILAALTAELAIFVLVVFMIHARFEGFVLVGLIGYAAGKIGTLLVTLFVPTLPLAYVWTSTKLALPGIICVTLLGVGAVLVKQRENND